MAQPPPPPPRGSSLAPLPDRVLSPRGDAQARRAARREQMANYYGLAPTPNPPLTPLPEATASTSASDPPAASTPTPKAKRTRGSTDFSSPNFVPAAYYEELIAKASLAELLKTTSTLATDVGRLHSSRHTLVYNHHHQLFSAGDTIAALNARTPQLLSIVTELQERFSEMSQLADSVGLPEPMGLDEKERVRATAEAGVERVRLMTVAGDIDGAKGVWEGVEKLLQGREGMGALVQQGRAIVGE